MAEYWYNNGQSVQSLGMVGYTGSSRYVVVYPFSVGSGGCSNVTVSLSNFYSFHGSNQTVSCKIGTSPSQYAAGTATPDGTGSMSYGSSWGGIVSCSVNLPAGTYYAAIYVTGSSGYWSTVYANAASISTSGSYTPSETTPTFGSVSNPVTTGSSVVLNMTNPSNVSLYVEFYYSGTLLATSNAFTTQLAYTCPRTWFSNNISVTSISIQMKIYKANGTLIDQSHSFTLNADSGMVPVVTSSSFAATKLNTGSIDAFISTLTKIQIDFARSGNSYVADMSNTAGSEIRSVWLEYNGIVYYDHETGYPYRYITSSITGSGYVRVWMEDSRGRQGYYDYIFVAYPYVPPAITSAEVVRCTESYPYSESSIGRRFKTKLYSSCSNINNANTAQIDAYFKETAAVSYTADATNLHKDDDIWTICAVESGSGKLDPSKTYMIKLVIHDTAGGSSAYEYYLSFEKWMICFTNTGDGCGIGQAPDSDNVLQIPSTWEFLAGSMRTGNDRMVLVEGKHYGTQAQMQAISNPVEGQVFFVLA